MITPEKMSSYEQNKVVEMYTKLNQDLTSQIINKLKSKGDISSYTEAQIKQLARQGGKEMLKEALKKINNMSSKQKKALEEIFIEIQNEELRGYKAIYKSQDKELKLSPRVVKLTNNIYKRTLKEFKNITKSVAFSSKTTYIKAMDDLYTKVATGSQDYSSAMKSTINDLIEKGITLKSKGKEYKIEPSVRRNLMTSLTQVANEMSEEIGKEIGANCVVIGHTPYCRPTHRVIDGVVMSLDKFKKYEYLTKEANCYHIVNYDWREEFENKKNKVKNNGHLTNKEYNKNYEVRQKQTYYAREVRSKKEEVAILKKGNNQELLEKKKEELKTAQMKYRQYCNAKGIDVDYDLTFKGGYNK